MLVRMLTASPLRRGFRIVPQTFYVLRCLSLGYEDGAPPLFSVGKRPQFTHRGGWRLARLPLLA
jgi:hypothetical protein